MSTIAATAGGTPALVMPDFLVDSHTWGQIANTRLGGAGTEYQSGTRWTFGVQSQVLFRDESMLRELRAFLVKLQGPSTPFFVREPGCINCCSVLGGGKTVSKTVVLPHCCVGDGLWAADDLWVADDLWLPAGNGPDGWPEYTFTLTASYDANIPLIVSGSVAAGADTIPIQGVSVGFIFANNNPWDYSQGTRTGYAEALQQAKLDLIAELGYSPADGLLKAGSWVQVNGMLLMLAEDLKDGDSSVRVAPKVNRAINSGSAMDYGTPGVLMRLADGEQVNFPAKSNRYAEPIQFSAVEW